MEFHVYENAQKACEAAAILIAAQITSKSDCILGLATGSTPIPVYEKLVEWYKNGVLDFSDVRSFNLDEYIGIDHKNPLSYHAFMQENLFDHVNIVWSVILIVLGGRMHKAKRNSLIGLRTKATLADDAVWEKGNRFAGKALILAGVLTIAESLLFGGILSTVLMVLNLIAAAIVSAVYAAKK